MESTQHTSQLVSPEFGWFYTMKANTLNRYESTEHMSLLSSPDPWRSDDRIRIRHLISAPLDKSKSLSRNAVRPHNGSLGWRIRLRKDVHA